jgi:hypothetical protein
MDLPGMFHTKVGVKGCKGHPGNKMKLARMLELAPVDTPVKGSRE